MFTTVVSNCGIDLHARSLYLCILDQKGQTLVHRKLPCERELLLKTLSPYRKDLVVAVECLFCWYWVADLCNEQGFEFVLGHALYMKAIHGGKTKNDRPAARTAAPWRLSLNRCLVQAVPAPLGN